MEGDKRKNHLIVLLHGLWGSAQNLSRLESVLHHSLEDSKVCKFHTYAPICFSHFKTYDGIESIGDYIIPDLFKHLEKLHLEHNITIDQISFIGYSLGGLIARYVLGELHDVGFFNVIKPGFFTTFATPHLGVTFYRNKFLNVLGTHLLGQTGRDLFMVEKYDSMIYKMSDPNGRYYKALNLFETKITISNIKFDRTVGFYSAFMTQYDVFNDWENIEAKFIPNLPTATLTEHNKLIKCLILDFNASKRVDPNSQIMEQSDDARVTTRKFAIVVVMTIGIFFFPVIFLISLFATVKSYFRNKILAKPQTRKLWASTFFKIRSSTSTTDFISSPDKTQYLLQSTNNKTNSAETEYDGYDEDANLKSTPVGISHMTRDLVENGLNVMNDDVDYNDNDTRSVISTKSVGDVEKSYFIDLDFELDYKSKSAVVNQLINNLDCTDLSKSQLTKNLDPLPFDHVREKVVNNLNTLNWTKIAILLHSLNAHQSVVGRRGFERTPEGIPFLFLYSFLIEASMKQHYK